MGSMSSKCVLLEGNSDGGSVVRSLDFGIGVSLRVFVKAVVT